MRKFLKKKSSIVDLASSSPLFMLSLISIACGHALLPNSPHGCALLLLVAKLELIFFLLLFANLWQWGVSQ